MNYKSFNKYIGFFGLVNYALLMLLAFIFYKERTMLFDIAFHAFYIIKDGDFAIQNFRFGSFPTQAIPLIGSKIGLNLASILKLYSVGFILLYFITFLISHFYFRTPRISLVYLLFSILIVTDTFYWIQSELPQGIAWMFLFFSALLSDRRKEFSAVLIPLLGFLLFTASFSHPLLIFPFFFILFYLFLNKDIAYKDFISAGLMYSLFYGLKLLFFKSKHDSGAMSASANFIELFPNYLTLESNKEFAKYLINDYYFLVPFFLIGLVSLWKENKYLMANLVALAFIGYLLLVNVSYPNGANQFYIENMYLPLSIIVIVPVVFNVIPRLKAEHVLFGIILIALIRIIDIAHSSKPYTARLETLREISTSFDGQKIILGEKDCPMDVLMMSWASPYEFWLISTVENNKTASIVIIDDPEVLRWTLSSTNKFVTKWGVFDYDELPRRYFKLNNRSENYVIKNLLDNIQ